MVRVAAGLTRGDEKLSSELEPPCFSENSLYGASGAVWLWCTGSRRFANSSLLNVRSGTSSISLTWELDNKAGPHRTPLRSADRESAFQRDPQVIHVHTPARASAKSNRRNVDFLREIKSPSDFNRGCLPVGVHVLCAWGGALGKDAIPYGGCPED